MRAELIESKSGAGGGSSSDGGSRRREEQAASRAPTWAARGVDSREGLGRAISNAAFLFSDARVATRRGRLA